MTTFCARWPSGRVVRFRPLTWAEFQRFERQQQRGRRSGEIYWDVYQLAVLEGPPPRDITGGMVDFVGRALTEHNPFNAQYADVKRALDLKRGELTSNYLLSARAVVAALFQIPVAEIEGWDAEKFFEYVAMAEFVSGRKLEPGDPTKKPAKSSKPFVPAARPSAISRPPVPSPPASPAKDPRPAEDPAPRLRRPLTPAQQLVLDRVRRAQ